MGQTKLEWMRDDYTMYIRPYQVQWHDCDRLEVVRGDSEVTDGATGFVVQGTGHSPEHSDPVGVKAVQHTPVSVRMKGVKGYRVICNNPGVKLMVRVEHMV